MDPPSDNYITEAYSSPVAHHATAEGRSYGSRVADLPIKKPSAPKSKKNKKVDIPEEIATWSPAKKSAWEARNVNPNAFYYRHVEPGQVKRTGAWDEDEKKMFMKAIKVHPPNQGKWGLFAMQIPGRVGYQCRNFYHRLLESGELKADDLPGEPVVIKKRQRKNTKSKVSVEPEDFGEEFNSEKNEESEKDQDLDDSPEEEPVKVIRKSPEPKAIQIKSLTLFSSTLNRMPKVEESNPIQAIEEAIKSIEIQIEQAALIEQSKKEETEPSVPEDIQISSPIPQITETEILVPINVEEVPIIIENTIPKEEPIPKWSRRMATPWKRASINGVEPTHIWFPNEEHISRPEFEYQCGKILRLNKDCSLNLLLLSFSAPEGKRRLYVKSVRKLLANNDEQILFSELLNDYFQVKAKMNKVNESERKRLSHEFVDKIVSMTE